MLQCCLAAIYAAGICVKGVFGGIGLGKACCEDKQKEEEAEKVKKIRNFRKTRNWSSLILNLITQVHPHIQLFYS